ncbi:hypothetical protein RA989_21040, partial [Mycobacteroides abscessus subsp. massiliense]
SSFEGRQELGVDFAGVVTAVGEGVTQHQVGARSRVAGAKKAQVAAPECVHASWENGETHS